MVNDNINKKSEMKASNKLKKDKNQGPPSKVRNILVIGFHGSHHQFYTL